MITRNEATSSTSQDATLLLDLTPSQAQAELANWFARQGGPTFRLRQALPRLWTRPVGSWQEATDLPADMRTSLDAAFPLSRLHLNRRQTSSDGTVKFLWDLDDGLSVESVWIPEGERRTLCISSQAGCAYGCVFCATGRMGFLRHLRPWEITAQIREMMLMPEFGKPTNVVFMGMGEPLHNWDAVDQALTTMNASDGLAIGARHITISTIGLIPHLIKLGRRPEQFRLAISLHGATTERRRALMPVEAKYPLAQLLPALRDWSRRVTFEYVMISGANDTKADAEALAQIARPLSALVNLLPLHPGGPTDLTPTTADHIKQFAKWLGDLHCNVSVRRSRGLDISAACGQLRSETHGVGGV